MKKHLRYVSALALGLLMSLGASAQKNVGDEISYNGSTYTVVGGNLISNGSFDESYDGWTSGTGAALPSAKFALQSDETSTNFLVGTTNEGVGGEGSIRTLFAIEAGKTYYYSYDVKSLGAASGEQGYLVTSLTNTVGTESWIVNKPSLTAGEWTAVEEVFTNTDGYANLQVSFRWLNSQFGFDNFELYELEFVGVDNTALLAEIAAAKTALETYNAEDAWAVELKAAIDAAEAATPATAEEMIAAINALKAAVAKAALDNARANALIKDGDYVLQNQETGFYLGGGNAWGTQASLLERPWGFGIAVNSDGTYTLDSYTYNSDVQHYLGATTCYVDQPATNWTIQAGNSEGLYTLSFDGKYLTAGEPGGILTWAEAEDPTAANVQWAIISPVAEQAKATIETPVNVTALVKAADIRRNSARSWTITGYGVDAAAAHCKYAESNNVNIVESWKSSNGFDMRQTLTDLKPGVYRLSAQGFYHNYDATDTNVAMLYANNDSVAMPLRNDDALAALSDAYKYMANDGKYMTDSIYVRVNEGETLTIGVANKGTNSWITFCRPVLAYYGDVTVAAILFPAELQAVVDAKAVANEAAAKKGVSQETKDAIAAAIAAADAAIQNATTAEALTAAVAALAAAADAANADNEAWVASQPVPGLYLIQNVENGQYLGGGQSWGTRASTLSKPQWLGLVAMEDGTYKLDSHQNNNGGEQHFLKADGYLDTDQAVALTFTKLEDGAYTIAVGDKFLTATAANKEVNMQGEDGTAKAAQWTLITMADVLAAQAEATAEAPADVTALVYNPELKRNMNMVPEGMSNWVTTSYDGTAAPENFSFGSNSAVANVAESYQSDNGFNVAQTLSGLKPGVYSLDAHAFYRQDGSDNDNLPVLYAGEEQTVLPKTDLVAPSGSMAEAYQWFLNGDYKTETLFVNVAEGTDLTIGFKSANTLTWNIFGELTLKYYGADADINALKNAALIAEYEAQKAEASENAQREDVSAVVKEQVSTTLAANESVEPTKEALTAAIEALKAVNAAAKQSGEQKAGIEGMEKLLASTNVYTAEAAATYQAEIDGYKTAWEAGTLTQAVQNPYAVYGWHSENTYDNLLLSAWTINDVKANEFDAALYINTWSVEGETDDSGFKTPFHEYWVGDAESLAVAKLTAKVEGLAAGTYDVTADVRVRIKNGAETANGITFEVPGAEPVDVCAGEQVGESQFRLMQVAATATVHSDGVLTITFNVAEGNTISWLSFQNVNYTLNTLDAIDAIETATESDNVYTLTGARAQKGQKGVVIVNGKKMIRK